MDLEVFVETPPWDWPEDAGETFQKALTDKQVAASQRVIAAELAGDPVAINDTLAATLLEVIGDGAEPEELRTRAAISLGPALDEADIAGWDDPDDPPAISQGTFRNIQETLQKLYLNPSTPKQVQRRILEAAVRAPEPWHEDAIRTAYASGDREWMLTAVFAMRFVKGFDRQILEALNNPDPEIHAEAVHAAGNWEVDAAWPHVKRLIQDKRTPKPLLLAAIGAVGDMRPSEAGELLDDLADSDDEDIAEAVEEAMLMASGSEDVDDEFD